MKQIFLLLTVFVSVTGMAQGIEWNNAQANELWDFSSTNWTSPDGLFSNGDDVVFGDTDPGTVMISGANVAPASMLFSNNYTIGSAASETLSGNITVADSGVVTIDSEIAGASAITIEGALTLNGANTFTGGTVVKSNATLVAGNDSALGSTGQATALTVEQGGTLSIGNDISLNSYGVGSIKIGGSIVKTTGGTFNVFNGQLDFIGDATIHNTVRLDVDGQLANNTGSRVMLTKTGQKTLYINNTISGAGFDWVIAQGQITMEGHQDSSLNSSFTVNSGTILQKNQNHYSVAGDLVLNGGTVQVSGDPNTWTFSGGLDVTDGSTINPAGPGSIMKFNGSLSGAGSLIIAEVGTVIFAGTTSGHTGGIVISSGGTLQINGNYSGSIGTILIGSGATLSGSGIWGGNVIIENGGTLDDSSLTINGTVSDAPVTFTSYSEAAGTNAPPTGWAFYWNAPTNWAVGTEGDLSSGAVSDRSSWRPMIWSGTKWTADGNNTANNPPSDHLQITGTGGHPGAAGATRELDRYAISAFTVGQAGDYEILLGKVSTQPSGNGVRVKIFLNGALHDELVVPNNDADGFSTIFNALALSDEIAVAVGANGQAAFDSYSLDYRISLLKPEYANPQIINVADYGAVGDGVTDDGPSVSAAILAWKNVVGPAALHFETNKTYFLGERTEHKSYFVLNGIFDKVVEGNGATFILTPSNRGFTITGCDNIVVRNFTVDYSPLPFSQGVISSINAGVGSFVFDPLPGYPAPIMNPGNKLWGTPYDPATQDIRYAANNAIHMESLTDLGNGTFEFQARADYISTISGLELNDLFVFRAYPATSIPGSDTWATITGNGAVAFDSVTLHSAPGFAFTPGSNTKPCLFRNITISPPPGSGRLVSSFGDGFHCNENRFGPIIEDGYFTYLMDDTMNIKSTGFRVNELVGGNILKLDCDDHLVGDVLQLLEDRHDVIGRATVVAINGYETELDVLPVGVNTNDTWVFNLSRANAGYVVQNNYFGTKRRCSGILRCGEGKVLNNVSERNDGWWVGNEIFYGTHEGPMASNILFQGNTVRNTRYGLWIHSSQNSQNTPRPIQDIRIIDNVFEDLPNLDISDAGNLLIQGNQFWATPIAVLDRVEDVTIGDSTGADGSFLLNEAALLAGSYNPAEITVERFLQSLSPTTDVFPFANLLAIFNDPIQVGSGDIIVRNLTDGIDTHIQTTDTSQVSVIGRELRIDPVADLIAGKDYAVLIEAGALLDEDGLALAGFSSESTWAFTVVDPATANIVLNGDFSENAAGFTEWPGYLTNNGNPSQINSWGFSKSAGVNGGINGVGLHTPFGPSNQTAVTYYGFLQSVGTQFSQDLTGRLAPNSRYQISFKAANRSGNSSALGQVTVGDDSTTFYDSGVQSWSTAAFQSVTAEFTTGAAFDGPVVITLRNDSPTGVDLTVNYSDVEIVKIDSYAVWVETYPSLDLSDPDGDLEPDGIPHRMEFALGGHPNVNDADALMPSSHSDGSSLNFVFRRADEAIGSDYEPYTAYSLNLLDWYPVTHGANGMTISVNDDGAATGVDEVTVEVDYDQADEDRMFLRLVVP